MRALLATVALVLSLASAHAQWSVEDMNRQIDVQNFVVNRGCSGTLIDAKDGLVLTAAHCIDAQYEDITVEDVAPDGTVTKRKVRKRIDGTVSQLTFAGTEKVQTVIYRTRLLGSNSDTDLALLKVASPLPENYQAARMACSSPKRGEQIYIVGNPMGSLYSSVTTGIVSSVQRDYELFGAEQLGGAKSPLMQVSGGVVGGNSGGSVWNSRGELVGVPVVAYTVNEVLGFAVPLESIKAFLKVQNREYLFAHCE